MNDIIKNNNEENLSKNFKDAENRFDVNRNNNEDGE